MGMNVQSIDEFEGLTGEFADFIRDSRKGRRIFEEQFWRTGKINERKAVGVVDCQ